MDTEQDTREAEKGKTLVEWVQVVLTIILAGLIVWLLIQKTYCTTTITMDQAMAIYNLTPLNATGWI